MMNEKSQVFQMISIVDQMIHFNFVFVSNGGNFVDDNLRMIMVHSINQKERKCDVRVSTYRINFGCDDVSFTWMYSNKDGKM